MLPCADCNNAFSVPQAAMDSFVLYGKATGGAPSLQFPWCMVPAFDSFYLRLQEHCCG